MIVFIWIYLQLALTFVLFKRLSWFRILLWFAGIIRAKNTNSQFLQLLNYESRALKTLKLQYWWRSATKNTTVIESVHFALTPDIIIKTFMACFHFVSHTAPLNKHDHARYGLSIKTKIFDDVMESHAYEFHFYAKTWFSFLWFNFDWLIVNYGIPMNTS